MVPGNDAFPIHPTLHRSLTVRGPQEFKPFPDEIILKETGASKDIKSAMLSLLCFQKIKALYFCADNIR